MRRLGEYAQRFWQSLAHKLGLLRHSTSADRLPSTEQDPVQANISLDALMNSLADLGGPKKQAAKARQQLLQTFSPQALADIMNRSALDQVGKFVQRYHAYLHGGYELFYECFLLNKLTLASLADINGYLRSVRQTPNSGIKLANEILDLLPNIDLLVRAQDIANSFISRKAQDIANRIFETESLYCESHQKYGKKEHFCVYGARC